MNTRKKVSSLKFYISIALFFALAYFVCWFIQFADPELFKVIDDTFFGKIPNVLNMTPLRTEVDLMGVEGTFAYAHFAGILAMLALLGIKKLNKHERILEDENLEAEEMQIKKMESINILQTRKEEKRRIILTNTFYGLFEFELTSLTEGKISKKDLEYLKNEFFKMMTRKLKNKYIETKFAINNKIFFIVEDFAYFQTVVLDFVKLFRVLKEVSDKKFIKMDLVFSLYMSEQGYSAKTALEILSKINAQRYFNKVIVSPEIKRRYEARKDKKFSLLPNGSVYMADVGEDIDDFEMELYSLKSDK